MLIAALAFGMGCGAVHTGPEPTVEQKVAPPPPALDSLVPTEWLSEHLGDPELVVLDRTVVVQQNEDGSVEVLNGRPNYDSGHIVDVLPELHDRGEMAMYARSGSGGQVMDRPTIPFRRPHEGFQMKGVAPVDDGTVQRTVLLRTAPPSHRR